MNFLSKTLLAGCAALLTAGSTASAVSVPFDGAIAAGATFNRPTSLTALSGTGTAVNYRVLPFTVNISGAYSILQIATTYDGYLLEYSNSFNPASPLTNLLNGDDDFDVDGTAGPLTAGQGSYINAGDTSNFAAANTLTAGTQYFLVSTTFLNGATGGFTGVVNGPGTATFGVVPEPTSLALLGAGLVGGLAWYRRRRAA